MGPPTCAVWSSLWGVGAYYFCSVKWNNSLIFSRFSYFFILDATTWSAIARIRSRWGLVHINPCPARPVYIRVQAYSKPNNMSLKMDNIVCGRCSVRQKTQFKISTFSGNVNIFRQLKLEIALAIPASNDEKYNLNNSAWAGLILPFQIIYFFYIWHTFSIIFKRFARFF